MPAPWLSGERGAWRLAVHVQPGASRSELVGEVGERLKLRIAAPPVDGKANDALVRWCAERLTLPRSAVSVDAGTTSRFKRVTVRTDLDEATLVARLLGATPRG